MASWCAENPLLFLGEWCAREAERASWEGLGAEFVTAFGGSTEQLICDTAKVRALEDALWNGLARCLNQTHGRTQDERYWRIIVGAWVRRFSIICFNRMATLDAAFEKHNISSISEYDPSSYSLAARNSLDFILAANDPLWNHIFWVHCRRLSCQNDLKVVNLGEAPEAEFRRNKPQTRRGLSAIMRRFLETFTAALSKNSKYFLVNSFLPKKEVLQLHLSLGQVPQIWSMVRQDIEAKVDIELRTRLKDVHLEKCGNDPELLGFIDLFWRSFPVSFLEGFDQIEKEGFEMGWPKSPRVIFTSNNYDYDDVFKVWAAAHVARGARYVIGQHGSNYGTNRFTHRFIEEDISDTFVTWGWDGDGDPRYVPAFVLKYPTASRLKYDPNGQILSIQLMSALHLYLHDVIGTFGLYFDDQVSFLKGLKQALREQVIVRLPGGSRKNARDEYKLWKREMPDVAVEFASGPMDEAVAKSRLVIFSYDSSGLMETLSQNIPAMAFWQNGLDHVRDEAKPYYQALVDVGVIHLSAESLADMLNKIGDDVEKWWSGKSVQKAVRAYCEAYARTVEDPVREMKCILENELRLYEPRLL